MALLLAADLGLGASTPVDHLESREKGTGEEVRREGVQGLEEMKRGMREEVEEVRRGRRERVCVREVVCVCVCVCVLCVCECANVCKRPPGPLGLSPRSL